jgi:hypothetical protein
MLSFRTFLEKAQSPDYTFDRWASSAEKLGSDVDSLVGQAKAKDAELEKSKKKAEKEKPKGAEESPDIEKDDAWKRVKQIAKERLEKKDQPEEEEESSKE